MGDQKFNVSVDIQPTADLTSSIENVQQQIDDNANAQVESLFRRIGIQTGTISLTTNSVQIVGTTPDNRRLVIKEERFGGYRRQAVSEYAGGDINDRREHARRLRREGLTQNAIAEQLDVSQKTISNYLK